MFALIEAAARQPIGCLIVEIGFGVGRVGFGVGAEDGLFGVAQLEPGYQMMIPVLDKTHVRIDLQIVGFAVVQILRLPSGPADPPAFFVRIFDDAKRIGVIRKTSQRLLRILQTNTKDDVFGMARSVEQVLKRRNQFGVSIGRDGDEDGRGRVGRHDRVDVGLYLALHNPKPVSHRQVNKSMAEPPR